MISTAIYEKFVQKEYIDKPIFVYRLFLSNLLKVKEHCNILTDLIYALSIWRDWFLLIILPFLFKKSTSSNNLSSTNNILFRYFFYILIKQIFWTSLYFTAISGYSIHNLKFKKSRIWNILLKNLLGQVKPKFLELINYIIIKWNINSHYFQLYINSSRFCKIIGRFYKYMIWKY